MIVKIPRHARQKCGRYDYDRGLLAEYAIIILLWLKGYRIVCHRYKSRLGEVDIIARRNDLLIAVEVKARSTRDNALSAITDHQWGRINRAMGFFVSRHPQFQHYTIRFDAAVVPTTLSFLFWPQHFLDAWRP